MRRAAACARKPRAWSIRLSFLRDHRGRRWRDERQNDAPFPYMIFFLAQGGVVLQVQLPLCIRDQDLDGRPVALLRRSFTSPETGQSFEQARIVGPTPRQRFIAV